LAHSRPGCLSSARGLRTFIVGPGRVSTACTAITDTSARECPEDGADPDPLQQAVGTQHHQGDDQYATIVRPCGLERGAGEEKGTNKTQDDGPAQRLAARRRHVEGRVRTWCRELPLTAALWAHGPSLGPWLFHDGPWAEVGDLTLLIRRNRLAPLIGTRAKARLATGMTQASTRADRGK